LVAACRRDDGVADAVIVGGRPKRACETGDVEFTLERSKALLTRTPASLSALLEGLPEEWTMSDEGPGTWSPYQVVGHMVHIEESDWIDRTRTILVEGEARNFEPIDREAGFSRFAGWPMTELLDRFRAVRASNLAELDSVVSADDLVRIGIHPTFGDVTLAQLLATWVVHDLNHLDQILKTMAKQYKEAIGPWREFLPIVDAP
jgi:hypothetical protein